MKPSFWGRFDKNHTTDIQHAESATDNIFHPFRNGFIGFGPRHDNQKIIKTPASTLFEIQNPNEERLVLEFSDTCNIAIFTRYGMNSQLLYFLLQNGQLFFSSSLRFLRTITGKSFIIDTDSLFSLLSLGFVPSPRTPFKNIFKLGPYQTCSLDLDTSSFKMSFIDEDTQHYDENLSSPQSLIDCIKEQFGANFALQRTNWHLLLSGGIDSSLLAFCVPPSLGITARVLQYGLGKKDEVDSARICAANANLILKIITLPEFSMPILRNFCNLLEEPCSDSALYCMMALAQDVNQSEGIISGFGVDILTETTSRQIKLYAINPDTPVAGVKNFLSTQWLHLSLDCFTELSGIPTAYDPLETLFAPYDEHIKTGADVLFSAKRIMERQFFSQGCIEPISALLYNMDRKAWHPYIQSGLYYFLKNLSWIGRNEKKIFNNALMQVFPAYQPQPRKLGLGIPLYEWLLNRKYLWDDLDSALDGLDFDKTRIRKLFKLSSDSDEFGNRKKAQLLWNMIVVGQWLKEAIL